VPEITGPELKQLLAAGIDFDAKSGAEAYLERFRRRSEMPSRITMCWWE